MPKIAVAASKGQVDKVRTVQEALEEHDKWHSRAGNSRVLSFCVYKERAISKRLQERIETALKTVLSCIETQSASINQHIHSSTQSAGCCVCFDVAFLIYAVCVRSLHMCMLRNCAVFIIGVQEMVKKTKSDVSQL